MEQQKYSPYIECYDDRLHLFKNKKYTHGVCYKLYGQAVRFFYLFLKNLLEW